MDRDDIPETGKAVNKVKARGVRSLSQGGGVREVSGECRELGSPVFRTSDEALAYQCGLYGLSSSECGNKLGGALEGSVISAYNRGLAEHVYSVMRTMYESAVVGGDAHLLRWLAERVERIETNPSTFAAQLSPEDRRNKIKELTRKLGLG